MYCIQCGRQIEDGAKFCMYCGEPVPQRVSRESGQKTVPTPTGRQRTETPAGQRDVDEMLRQLMRELSARRADSAESAVEQAASPVDTSALVEEIAAVLEPKTASAETAPEAAPEEIPAETAGEPAEEPEETVWQTMPLTESESIAEEPAWEAVSNENGEAAEPDEVPVEIGEEPESMSAEAVWETEPLEMPEDTGEAAGPGLTHEQEADEQEVQDDAAMMALAGLAELFAERDAEAAACAAVSEEGASTENADPTEVSDEPQAGEPDAVPEDSAPQTERLIFEEDEESTGYVPPEALERMMQAKLREMAEAGVISQEDILQSEPEETVCDDETPETEEPAPEEAAADLPESEQPAEESTGEPEQDYTEQSDEMDDGELWDADTAPYEDDTWDHEPLPDEVPDAQPEEPTAETVPAPEVVIEEAPDMADIPQEEEAAQPTAWETEALDDAAEENACIDAEPAAETEDTEPVEEEIAVAADAPETDDVQADAEATDANTEALPVSTEPLDDGVTVLTIPPMHEPEEYDESQLADALTARFVEGLAGDPGEEPEAECSETQAADDADAASTDTAVAETAPEPEAECEPTAEADAAETDNTPQRPELDYDSIPDIPIPKYFISTPHGQVGAEAAQASERAAQYSDGFERIEEYEDEEEDDVPMTMSGRAILAVIMVIIALFGVAVGACIAALTGGASTTTTDTGSAQVSFWDGGTE